MKSASSTVKWGLGHVEVALVQRRQRAAGAAAADDVEAGGVQVGGHDVEQVGRVADNPHALLAQHLGLERLAFDELHRELTDRRLTVVGPRVPNPVRENALHGLTALVGLEENLEGALAGLVPGGHG